MRFAGRAFLVALALLFGASMSGLCLCAEHLALLKDVFVQEHAHGPSHEEANAHSHDHGDHSDTPTPLGGSSDCGGCGGCGSGDGYPLGRCCCAADAYPLAVQPVTLTKASLLESSLLLVLPAELRSGLDHYFVKTPHPPPNEGFKLWPEASLFLKHSSFLL